MADLDATLDRPKYKWDWNEKLNASPFRIEINRLKEDSKKHPQQKRSNNEFKRILKQKEKELLVEFQMKCDQAKIWINEANKSYGDENSDNPEILQQIEYQKQEEKIRTIDQFWEELLCQQTIFLQNEKIKHQHKQMEELQQQLKETERTLHRLNAMKNNKNSASAETAATTASVVERTNNDDDHKTDTQQQQKQKQTNKSKKKKKKKKKDKDEYLGLVGYFNKPRKQNKPKNPNAKQKKTNQHSAVTTTDTVSGAAEAAKPGGGFYSFSYVPKAATDAEAVTATEEKQGNVSNPVDADTKPDGNAPEQVDSEKQEQPDKAQPKQAKNAKKKKKKASRVIKGGFLNQGTKGLYDDKKLDSELTVDERNAKNKRQINEMGFADAVDKPFYTWERPKMAEREQTKHDPDSQKEALPKADDPLTQLLNEQAQLAESGQ